MGVDLAEWLPGVRIEQCDGCGEDADAAWPRTALPGRWLAEVPPPARLKILELPMAARVDTPNARATSAWVAPWANLRAASRRRTPARG
jgi:hypothetical protein